MGAALPSPVLRTARTSPESAERVGTWASLDQTTWRAWTVQTVGGDDVMVDALP